VAAQVLLVLMPPVLLLVMAVQEPHPLFLEPLQLMLVAVAEAHFGPQILLVLAVLEAAEMGVSIFHLELLAHLVLLTLVVEAEVVGQRQQIAAAQALSSSSTQSHRLLRLM
jgi:hypothetical protein